MLIRLPILVTNDQYLPYSVTCRYFTHQATPNIWGKKIQMPLD